MDFSMIFRHAGAAMAAGVAIQLLPKSVRDEYSPFIPM